MLLIFILRNIRIIGGVVLVILCFGEILRIKIFKGEKLMFKNMFVFILYY